MTNVRRRYSDRGVLVIAQLVGSHWMDESVPMLTATVVQPAEGRV